MNTLTDCLLYMSEENTTAATLQEAASDAGHKRESLYWQMDELRKAYGRPLRKLMQKRASRIVRKHSLAWCVDVDIVPMHDHTTHLTRPMVKIQWADKGAEIRMTCIGVTPSHLEQFLDRFEKVVMACQLHRSDAGQTQV